MFTVNDANAHTVNLGFKPKNFVICYTAGARGSTVIWDAAVSANTFGFSYVPANVNTGLTGSANLGSATNGTTFNLTSTGFTVTYATYGAYQGGLGTVYYIAE